MNEGEIATYLITWKFATLAKLQPWHSFLIRFPKEFDPLLAKYKLTVASTTLTGALKFTVRQRDLIFTGFNDDLIVQG